MAQVKLDFGKKTIQQKLAAMQTVITDSTGNPLLPSPQPKLTALSTAKYNLNAAANAADAADQAAKAAHATQNAAEEAADFAYADFGGVVQDKTNGSEAGILSTGYGVQSTSHAPIVLGPPADYSVTTGDVAGEIDWHCHANKDARNFEGQATSDLTGATGWGNSTFSSKSKGAFTGLTSGAQYATRLRALGTTTGPWSQVVLGRAG
jgi:hypothetical protein